MSAELHRKITVSVPPDVVDGLDQISRSLNISRSAVLTEILRYTVPNVSAIARLLPPPSSTDDVRRMRGQSADAIQKEIRRLIEFGGQDDLFTR